MKNTKEKQLELLKLIMDVNCAKEFKRKDRHYWTNEGLMYGLKIAEEMITDGDVGIDAVIEYWKKQKH